MLSFKILYTIFECSFRRLLITKISTKEKKLLCRQYKVIFATQSTTHWPKFRFVTVATTYRRTIQHNPGAESAIVMNYVEIFIMFNEIRSATDNNPEERDSAAAKYH